MQRSLILATLAMLGGCGGVAITPQAELPPALIEAVPAKVGLLLTPEQRNFVHSETRNGVLWEVTLGPGKQQLSRSMFAAAFRDSEEFSDLDTARAASGLQAIFEPRIEQFSFATAQETGGNYVAVSIRYRIDVRTPNGERYDSLTLTGYGTSMADGMSSAGPIEAATRAAKRDAAAKFLTQFSALPLAAELTSGVRLEAVPEAMAAATIKIDALPVRVSRRLMPDWRPPVNPPEAAVEPAVSP